jgi:hypothetical protein
MPIDAPWARAFQRVPIQDIWVINGFLYMIPFFIALAMWLAWLPRLLPSVIDALKGKEWTLQISEGQQFSEKFDTKKDEV